MRKYLKFNLKALLLLTLLVAIWLGMHSNKANSIEEVNNIRIYENSEDHCVFKFEETIARRDTDQILELLDVGGRVEFFDSKKTLSDPGIYVDMVKMPDQRFAAYFGNHGWTSKWMYLTKNEAHDYFWISHDDNLVTQSDWPYTTKIRFRKTGSCPDAESLPDNQIYIHIQQLVMDFNSNDD